MQPEAHSFVGYSLDCLWATGSIVRQRLAAKGWSAGLVTPPICAAEQPIRTSMRRRQTACRSWSVGRPGSFPATCASHSMQAVVSQPLSSTARPAEAGRARGRTRRTTWRRFACATFLLVRGRAASLGGSDLKKSDVLPHNRLALPRSAASVHGVGNEGDWYVAAVARYIPIQLASRDSNALKKESDWKTAFLTLAVERDAAMAVGRPHGDAIDGAVLVGRQRITCDLASLPSRPYH